MNTINETVKYSLDTVNNLFSGSYNYIASYFNEESRLYKGIVNPLNKTVVDFKKGINAGYECLHIIFEEVGLGNYVDTGGMAGLFMAGSAALILSSSSGKQAILPSVVVGAFSGFYIGSIYKHDIDLSGNHQDID